MSQSSNPVKQILLQQLRKTHSEMDWFVPIGVAIDELSESQAQWKDLHGNHSIAELVSHLIFWNEQKLAKFKGQPTSDFQGSNDETFAIQHLEWRLLVRRVNLVLADWEKAIEEADETKLKDWYPTIALISTHNAYHTGQIIVIRKAQGSWDPEHGVR